MSTHYNYPMSASYKLSALNLLGKLPKFKICSRYHITKTTLNRWIRRYDGTIESLENKSHRPLTAHPTAHTEEEIKHIKDLIKRNPHIGLNELYGKLRTNYAYTRNPSSLFRFLKKNKLYDQVKKEPYKPKPYETPLLPGEKWQMDVKYVPMECKATCISGTDRFYQYTMIDECTRERFIYAYREQCASSTIDFVMRSILYFGYKPKIIQTDNGQEFTHLANTNRKHLLDQFCKKYKIIHKLIKPRTPRHNGKVERSHRNDNERFYKYLKFHSFEDLQKQMRAYLERSNNIPSRVLGWLSPVEYRKKLENN